LIDDVILVWSELKCAIGIVQQSVDMSVNEGQKMLWDTNATLSSDHIVEEEGQMMIES
jgi:hypothetical protein